MDNVTVCSSATKDGLQNLAKEYFYSSSIVLEDDGSLTNAKGRMNNYRWEYKNRRFKMLMIKAK